MAEMTISGLAREGGVGVETVRYYQRRGLLGVPERGAGTGLRGGMRRYGAADLRRLRFIRAAQGAGFTLEEIRDLLALEGDDNPSGDGRARVRALAAERIAVLDARIGALEAARASLARLARECAATIEGPCPIIASFEGEACPYSPPHSPPPHSRPR